MYTRVRFTVPCPSVSASADAAHAELLHAHVE